MKKNQTKSIEFPEWVLDEFDPSEGQYNILRHIGNGIYRAHGTLQAEYDSVMVILKTLNGQK